MIVIDKLVIALTLEAEKFNDDQKNELQTIIKKIDITLFPTEYEIKTNPKVMSKFFKHAPRTQEIFSEYGRKYEEFGGSEQRMKQIIKENMRVFL